MRLLWAVVDGGGNLPPQLAVAKVMRDRGIDVHFIGHQGVRDRVVSEGFSFETMSEGRQFDPTIQRPLAVLMADFARVASDRRVGRDIVAAARGYRADAIVVDVLLTGGIDHVITAEFPTIVLVHCFYRAVQDLASSPVGWFLRARGIAPLGPQKADVLHIVSARADLDPVRGEPTLRHVGVVWQGAPTAAREADVPRVLVSLSTCAFAGQRRMLHNILEAVAPLDIDVTVTTGPSIDADGLRVPANTSLHSWLDHDAVLSTSSLLIGHGGHSTTMRALSFGVPVLVMPANPFIDQKRVGQALERAGAGVLISKHSSSSRIRRSVQTILGSATYRARAADLGASIRESDGATEAVDAIRDFVTARIPQT